MSIYISTRGGGGEQDFETVLLEGLARDGGLYVPKALPFFDKATLKSLALLPYEDVACKVLEPMIGGSIKSERLQSLIKESYKAFRHKQIAPLSLLEDDLWLLELYHGPTFAFKDIAMQVLARLFNEVLEKRGEHITILGATSGDTGASAVKAFAGLSNVKVVMLYPKGKIARIPRKQMTTLAEDNIFVLAVEGTFDDCQKLVKEMFLRPSLKQRAKLGAVNSINWLRIAAQSVYYLTSGLYLKALESPVSFSVPTGNFGDIYAGYVAKMMGLPIESLIVATNANDLLARVLATGVYEPLKVKPTLSPSMDIQVASNFERLLFEASKRDGDFVKNCMEGLEKEGSFKITPDVLREMQEVFKAKHVSDKETLSTISHVAKLHDRDIDPHTAVGVCGARAFQKGGKVVSLATADAAKFPVEGQRPCELPEELKELEGKKERKTVIEACADKLEFWIRRALEL